MAGDSGATFLTAFSKRDLISAVDNFKAGLFKFLIKVLI